MKPSFDGKLISVKYVLHIKLKHDMICAEEKGMALPIKILLQPAMIDAPEVMTPEGWAPYVYGQAAFVIPPSGDILEMAPAHMMMPAPG